MQKITLKIDGMMCGMCEAHMNDAIRKAFNVEKVTSDHKKGITEIVYKDGSVDESKLEGIVKDTCDTLEFCVVLNVNELFVAVSVLYALEDNIFFKSAILVSTALGNQSKILNALINVTADKLKANFIIVLVKESYDLNLSVINSDRDILICHGVSPVLIILYIFYYENTRFVNGNL